MSSARSEIEEILTQLSSNDIRSLIKQGMDFSSLSDDQKRMAIRLALHCVCNGPVGVNKATNFTGIVGAPRSIQGLIGVRITNSVWTEFCRTVAELVKKDFAQLVVETQTYRACGDLWPIADWNPQQRGQTAPLGQQQVAAQQTQASQFGFSAAWPSSAYGTGAPAAGAAGVPYGSYYAPAVVPASAAAAAASSYYRPSHTAEVHAETEESAEEEEHEAEIQPAAVVQPPQPAAAAPVVAAVPLSSVVQGVTASPPPPPPAQRRSQQKRTVEGNP